MKEIEERQWAPVHGLIEAEKTAAWDEMGSRPLRTVPRVEHRPLRRLRPAFVAASLLAVIGIIIALKLSHRSQPTDIGSTLLTLADLPLFQAQPAAKPGAAMVPESELGRQWARMFASLAETVEPPPVDGSQHEVERGDRLETRENIRRIIRDNLLERFITRLSQINQEV